MQMWNLPDNRLPLHDQSSISFDVNKNADNPFKSIRYIGVWLIRLVFAIYLALSVLVVILVVFASETSFAPFNYAPSLPAIASAVFACFLVAIALFFAKSFRQTHESKRARITVLISGSIILFAVQCIIVVSISYKISWDPGTILGFAQAVANNESIDQYKWYYDLFPNNYLLTVIFIFICEHSGQVDPAIVAGIVGAALINIACALTAVTARRITKSTIIATLAWLAFAVLGCLSPWISVPYSDVYATVFVGIGLCSISFVSSKNEPLKNIALGFVFGISLFVGGLMKPNILVIAIAAGLSCALIALAKCTRFFNRQALFAGIGVLVAVCLTYGAVQPWVKHQIEEIYIPDREAAVSFTHFLMMGANAEHFGYFNFDDYAISRDVPTYDERQRVNLEEFCNRLKSFGLSGYLLFEARKLTVIYNDGSFYFGGEGQVLPPDGEHLKENPLGIVSSTLRDLMYFNKGHFFAMRELEQIIWIAILILLPFSVRHLILQNRDDFTIRAMLLVLIVSFIGITIFLLLFEARSRYLFCCLPVFILLSSAGLSSCVSFIGAKTERGLSEV